MVRVGQKRSRGKSTDSAALEEDAVVLELRDAVKAKRPNRPAHADAADLVACANKEAYEGRVEEGQKTGDLGKTEMVPLFVLGPLVSAQPLGIPLLHRGQP